MSIKNILMLILFFSIYLPIISADYIQFSEDSQSKLVVTDHTDSSDNKESQEVTSPKLKKIDRDFLIDVKTYIKTSLGFSKIQKCINEGANVNVFDYDGTTALIKAVVNNKKELASLLIEKGANPNIQSKKEHSNGNTALMEAVALEYIELVRLLVEHGQANVNQGNDYNVTPLIISAYRTTNKSLEISSYLIDSGANAKHVSNNSFCSLAINSKIRDLWAKKHPEDLELVTQYAINDKGKPNGCCESYCCSCPCVIS